MYDRQKQEDSASGQIQERATNQTGYGLSPVTPPPNKIRSEVAIALETQETTTRELLEIVNALAMRLKPVLATGPQQHSGTGDPPDKVYISPIAACVQQNTERMREASAAITTLMLSLAI